jgi:hypothetical protein
MLAFCTHNSNCTPRSYFDSLLSVKQYLDLAGFHFGAETSQLMGFSARALAGLSC